MPDVGVRELKARASEIIRNVRERRARYVITYRGRPVGVLLPLDEATQAEAVAGAEQAAFGNAPVGGCPWPAFIP